MHYPNGYAGTLLSFTRTTDAERVPLTRDLRQRMTEAAFEDWLEGFAEEAVETVPVSDYAFSC